MKILAKDTWQIMKLNLKNVLLFELLYRLVTLPVYLRILNRGIRFALKMAGYSYLTANNIGLFFIRPWTIMIILMLGIAGMLFLMIEIAGLITAYQGSAYGQRLTPLHILWGGIQKTAHQLKRKNIKLFVLTAVGYGLMNLAFIGRAFTHIKPVNFVLQEMLQMPMGRLVVILFLVLCLGFVIPFMFVPFGCMVEQKSFLDGMNRSRSLLKGHLRKSLSLLLWSHALVVLITVVVYGLSVVFAAIFVTMFTQRNLAMAVLLSVTDRLELVLIFLGGIWMAISNYGALSVLYFQLGNQRLKEPRWDFSYPARGSKKRVRILAAAGVIAGLGAFYILDMVQNGFSLSGEILMPTQITAHRGSSRSAPENTLSAMTAAIEELADFGEIDVQMTSDGVVVLGHDASLKRVAGINKSIGSLTLQELKELDVGSWFSPQFSGEQVPTLEEVIEVCKGKLNLNIEIKNIGKESLLPQKVVELIIDYGLEEQCVVTSTSLNYLKKVKELEPRLRTGYIISAAYGNFYSSEEVDFISIRSSFVNESLVENVHEQGKAVHAWTVNSKSEMERLRLMGVDNLITDYPVLAREIIYREEATETLMEYLRLVFR